LVIIARDVLKLSRKTKTQKKWGKRILIQTDGGLYLKNVIIISRWKKKKMLFKFCVMNGDSRIIREKHLHSHSPLINKYVARIAHGFLDL
jgi:hypothetical protein